MCMCVSVGGGGGSNNQKKTKKIGMMRGGKTKDEKWRGVGINLGGLRNNWEKKKISGGNLPLIYVCGKWFSK